MEGEAAWSDSVGNHAYNGTVEVSRCCDDFNILGDRDFGRPPAPVVKCHTWKEKRPGQIGVGNHAYNGTVEVT